MEKALLSTKSNFQEEMVFSQNFKQHSLQFENITNTTLIHLFSESALSNRQSVALNVFVLLAGRIITVETVRMRYRHKGMDTDIGFHSYDAGNSRLIISILRVFYARMEPMRETIGV